jgi:hypothetical protein
VSRIGYPDLSFPLPEITGPPAKPKAVPGQKGQENLPPEGASTPDGVGCRIGRGYSVFARKGKPIAPIVAQTCRAGRGVPQLYQSDHDNVAANEGDTK